MEIGLDKPLVGWACLHTYKVKQFSMKDLFRPSFNASTPHTTEINNTAMKFYWIKSN